MNTPVVAEGASDASVAASPILPSPPPFWIRPIEWLGAALCGVVAIGLLIGVASRYLFGMPLVWMDEAISLGFIWLSMTGSILAMQRGEHLRLALFVEMMPPRVRPLVQALALAAIAAVLLALIGPALDYVEDEWFITTPALEIRNSFRVAAIAFGMVGMLLVVCLHAWKSVAPSTLLVACAAVALVAAACWLGRPIFASLGNFNLLLFMVGFAALCLIAGVPIAFCFAIGAVSYLAFSTQVPLQVVIGRMDEGMSSLVLVSVPVFVLLGCILDHTGMGKAIVDFLASLLGHVKAGMSYVLLTALFIVSGISGSKVSDMATVAPALFPEMKRRGHKSGEMVALLATGAAMADTVPPSIVLIVLGAVAGVSIAGLFNAGFVIALVLLIVLMALARWKARHEDMHGAKRQPWSVIAPLIRIAGAALVLPFLIRIAVGEGIATATEVSSVAVAYALVAGHFIYGGITWRKLYGMLVETAALSGAVLLVLGAASAIAWAVTQSGVVQQLSVFLTSLPGGSLTFMAVSIVVFLFMGCLLEGLPAILLLAPIMFPIAQKLGIHDIQYSMVIVCAMNIGLMIPPIGVGFYIACRIGEAKPDEVMRAIWSYLAALLLGTVIIATVPWLSTVAL